MSIHEFASAWWSWIAPLTLQAAALALGLAVFDLVARRRIWPSVRAALWWVVVLRFVLPPGVFSPWSVVPSFTTTPGLAPAAAPEATSTSWSWAALLAALWGIGVSAGAWREWRRERALRLELARTQDAPAHVVRVLERLSRRMGLRRAPRLRVSAHFSSPLLIGWWRPVVVLPVAMAREEDETLDPRVARRDLALALVHELTHVRRNHALQSALLRALHAVFWFHPAAWIATRRLAELRELVCDAAVIRGRARLAEHYRDALLRVAGRVRHVPRPAQAFFAGSSLLLRLEWLDRRATRLRALHAPLAAAVFASACACLLPGAPVANALAGLDPEVARALDRLRRAIAADERQNCLEVQAAAQVLAAHRELTGEDLIATLADDAGPSPASSSPH